MTFDPRSQGPQELWGPRQQPQPYQGQWPPPQPQQGWQQQQPQYQQPQYPLQAYPQQWQPAPYPQPGYAPQAPATPPRNTALIIILSFLIPGLGSLYGGSYVHGAIILAAFLLSAFLILAGIGIFLVPVTWIWGMIAACVLAGRR
jgi:TM2 domain-containing membrane protein YozV